MDLAVEHMTSNNLSEMIIAPINQVQLHEKVTLPCELVGLMGNRKTKCFQKVSEESSLTQEIKFLKVPKSSKKSARLWEEFLDWIVGKQGITTCDFNPKFKSKMCVTPDEKFVKEMNDEGIFYYEKASQAHGRNKHEQIKSCTVINLQKVIGLIELKGTNN